MILVSGVSRSGTSLMMACLVKSLGKDRVFGEQFPQSKRIEHLDKPYDDESPELFDLRQYATKDYHEKEREAYAKSVDMNPLGFWESPYAVGGLYYRWDDRANLLRWETESEPTFCKIVARGLWKTDPCYVDKIIYMVREPRAVAKSQERLERGLPEFVGSNGEDVSVGDFITVHTPLLYINATARVCAWLSAYPDIPLIRINFDDLVEQPAETLGFISDFIDEDLSDSLGVIKPALRRSAPEKIEHKLWKLADQVYELFNLGEYEAVTDAVSAARADIFEETGRFHCFRRDSPTVPHECAVCRRGIATVEFKKDSIKRGVDWESAPCSYECGMGPEPHINVATSVADNFWRDVDATA